jgi:cation diffusion facilitator family transporter
MASEGIHSLVDTGNQLLLLHGLKQAKQPPDELFPFGHGKEIYFWSFVVAILIFAVGAGVSIYQGVQHMLRPAELVNPLINYVVLSLAILFEAGAWWFAFTAFGKAKGRQGYFQAVRTGKDPTLFVVLFEDSAALIGLVVAMVGIAMTQLTGNGLYDGMASVAIGAILGGAAIWLAHETKGLLIGEGARPEVVAGIKRIAASLDIVVRVNEVLTMHMGPEYVLVTLSLEFEDAVAIEQLERAIEGLDRRIREEFPDVKKIFVEAESLLIGGAAEL